MAAAQGPGQSHAELVAHWWELALSELGAQRGGINACNSYPVRDADTGNNAWLTLNVAGAGVGTVRERAQESLRGARGSSGMLLAPLFFELAVATEPALSAQASDWDSAFRRAYRRMVALVAAPAEGSLISVLREALGTQGEPSPAGDVGGPGGQAGAATRYLARLAEQVFIGVQASGAVMTAAGYPCARDAGAWALSIIIDALAVAAGATLGERPLPNLRPTAGGGHASPGAARPAGAPAEPPEMELTALPETEVTANVGVRPGADPADLRAALSPLGTELIVSQLGDGAVRVHIHTRAVAQAIQTMVDHGQMSRLRLERLVSPGAPAELGIPAGHALPVAAGTTPETHPARTIVAFIAEGPVAEVFREAGVLVLAPQAPGERRPSLPALDLAALPQLPATGDVIVVPNGALSRADMVALDAAGTAVGRRVSVIPARSVPQGLAALAVHDPQAPFVVDVYAMADAAAGVRRGSLRLATEAALTFGGPCSPGDVLALAGQEILFVGPPGSQGAQLRNIIEALAAAGAEIVSVVHSEGVGQADLAALAAHVRAHLPGVELHTYLSPGLAEIAQIGVE